MWLLLLAVFREDAIMRNNWFHGVLPRRHKQCRCVRQNCQVFFCKLRKCTRWWMRCSTTREGRNRSQLHAYCQHYFRSMLHNQNLINSYAVVECLTIGGLQQCSLSSVRIYARGVFQSFWRTGIFRLVFIVSIRIFKLNGCEYHYYCRRDVQLCLDVSVLQYLFPSNVTITHDASRCIHIVWNLNCAWILDWICTTSWVSNASVRNQMYPFDAVYKFPCPSPKWFHLFTRLSVR